MSNQFHNGPEGSGNSRNHKTPPKTLRALSKAYLVSEPTMRNLISPIAEKIGERLGYYYTPRQVDLIYQFLGPPNK